MELQSTGNRTDLICEDWAWVFIQNYTTKYILLDILVFNNIIEMPFKIMKYVVCTEYTNYKIITHGQVAI